MKTERNPSFADTICETRSRKIKNVFFNQVNLIVDWAPISKLINQHYSRGISATGKPAYAGLLLFKMSLLQTWYGLSDYEVEDRINDSISFSKFCGLTIEEVAPDHSTLSRFRKEMTDKKVYDRLLRALNFQLETHKIIVKKGAIVDASIIDSPLKPKGTARYEVVNDREQDTEHLTQEQKKEEVKALVRIEKSSVDTEAAWIKKGGKLRYGYKKHIVTDEEGIILGLLTTPANVNEISNLKDVLEGIELPKRTPFFGDKGYQSDKNKKLLMAKRDRKSVV